MFNDLRNNEGFRILQRVAAKALDDDQYRKDLIANANDELKKAGLVVPEGVKVVVHENTADELHLVLPACRPLDPEDTNVVSVFSICHVF